jgi:hypothetical protein
MMQCAPEAQEQVFDFIVATVTRTTYELNNHAGVLDRFVLAVNEVLTTRTNPLAHEREVIFWHNHRTQLTPYAAVFNASTQDRHHTTRWFAFRLESVLSVVKFVTGRVFQQAEIMRAVTEQTWTARGKGSFYDCQMNAWPIASRVFEQQESNVPTLVPLAETDLHMEHLKEFPAVYFKQDKWNEIVNSVNNAVSLETDYKTTEIESANQTLERPNYNLYNAVTKDGWFGYRAVASSNFGVCTFPKQSRNNGIHV